MNATCDNPADVNAETLVFLVDPGKDLALIDAGRPDLI
jgi:hypothetical protein